MTHISTIIRKADKLTSYFDSAPIDLVKIAKISEININITTKIMEDHVSGFITLKYGQYHIVVNSNHVLPRQRFTIAHEIGHYVLGHLDRSNILIDSDNERQFRLYRSGNQGVMQNNIEREANIFAANLLMPARLLVVEAQSHVFDSMKTFDVIEELAKRFNVSLDAMRYRLINLNIIEPYDF